MKKMMRSIVLFLVFLCALPLPGSMGETGETLSLHQLPTVDNQLYRLSLRLIDHDGAEDMNAFLGDSEYHGTKAFPGLVSGCLGEDGYPVNQDGESMAALFGKARPVYGLFLSQPHDDDGVWLFDSTQCFASIDQNHFKVYRELGTADLGNSATLDRGQFLPFNDLTPGLISARHPANLRDALGNELPTDDPRQGEALYGIPEDAINYFFGLEMEAEFSYPAGGKGPQNEDLIARFTADDDLWVYIDGFLVLDLGGVHSAIDGSVNFTAGTVTCRDSKGKEQTVKLYKLFQQRYREKYPSAQEQEMVSYLNGIFHENNHWQMVLNENTTHTLRLFYLERGAGASNLSIRFNMPVKEK